MSYVCVNKFSSGTTEKNAYSFGIIDNPTPITLINICMNNITGSVPLQPPTVSIKTELYAPTASSVTHVSILSSHYV